MPDPRRPPPAGGRKLAGPGQSSVLNACLHVVVVGARLEESHVAGGGGGGVLPTATASLLYFYASTDSNSADEAKAFPRRGKRGPIRGRRKEGSVVS